MSWRKKHIFINLSWHGGHGPLLSPFEGLEVPKLYRSSIVWPGLSKTPAPFQPCGSHSFASSVHCWTQDLAKILESFWACYIRFSLGNKKLALSFLANDSYYEFHSSLKLGFLDVGLLYHRALKKALHPGFFRLLGSLSVLASSTGLIASNFKSSLFTCWKS